MVPTKKQTTSQKSSTSASATHQLNITGTIMRVHFSNETFSAGKIQTEDTVHAYKANFATKVNDRVTLAGSFIDNPPYGVQFAATGLSYEADLTPDGLRHFLTVNKAFRGIGPVKAQQIVSLFGNDFENALTNLAAEMMEKIGLSRSDMDTLTNTWMAHREDNLVFSYLAQFGLTQHQMAVLVKRFGCAIKGILADDPYVLAREVHGFGFSRADEVALKLGTPKDHPGRIRACVAYVALSVLDDGHCWMTSVDLVAAAEKLLALDNMNARQLIQGGISDMVEAGELAHEQIKGISYMAHPSIYHAENSIYESLCIAKGIAAKDDAETLGEYAEDLLPDLNDGQQTALTLSLKNRICLITGEAGTGKSYTINAIRTAFLTLDKKIALAAPTGKAAKRLEEMCEQPASTIHRLLGYTIYDGKPVWTFNANNPLLYDVVIIDETGMVDSFLAQKLFDAIDFTRTRLILVGDHQQLPPVGPGNLLRDLLHQGHVPAVTLAQVMRQAGILKQNCVGILQGQLAGTAPGESGTQRPWYVLDHTETPQSVVDMLLRVMDIEVEKIGFNAINDVQVLTPYNKGPLGTVAMNWHLQRLIQNKFHGGDLPPVPIDIKTRAPFLLHDRVMQTRNNYTLDMMNGTQGTVVGVHVSCREVELDAGDGDCLDDDAAPETILVAMSEEEILDQYGYGGKKPIYCLSVQFDGYPSPTLIREKSKDTDDLVLAYAISIHKSQGSEYPCAVVICAREHSYMLSRNLLYTGVTRARKTAILIGDRVAMKRALAKTDATARNTWLSIWPVATPAIVDELDVSIAHEEEKELCPL